MSESIKIDDLLIVDVPHADKVGSLAWKGKAFFAAEECDRQLLIGHRDQINLIPDDLKRIATTPANSKKLDSDIIIGTGTEAYRHLVNVAVGLLDKQLGEKETIEGIRARWLNFTTNAGVPAEELATRKKRYDPIIQALFTDSRSVRAKVFDDRVGGNYLRPVSTEPAVAARNLLDIKSIDKILIIGEKLGITENTLKVIDTVFRKQDSAGENGGIILTHPDKATLDSLRKSVDALIKDKKLKGAVTCVEYNQAMSDIFPKADFVINCQPMDNGTNDLALKDASAKRTNPTGMLVHLKGVPINRNATSDIWKKETPENVVFIESLKRQDELDRVHNQRMKNLATKAITNCVYSRSIGKRPVEMKLLLDEDQYATFVNNAKNRSIKPDLGGARSPTDHGTRPRDERFLG